MITLNSKALFFNFREEDILLAVSAAKMQTTFKTIVLEDLYSGNYARTSLCFRNSVTVALVFLMSLLHSANASWLYLGLPKLFQAVSQEMMEGLDHIHSSLEFLQPNQIKLYDQDIRTLHVISRGAFITIKECQEQFKRRRWNCPVYNKTNVFGPAMTLKTRETAFISALSSAGLTYAVTKACARGELEDCGCDSSPQRLDYSGSRSDYSVSWDGCFDDVGYGSRFSRQFLDSQEQYKTATGSMNIWNYNAGRKVLQDNMEVDCRCHGPTGGCNIRTCWRRMASFTSTGNILKEKFEEATIVRWSKTEGRLEPSRRDYYKPPTKRDLVYLDRSPSYCDFDPEYGSPGTKGRQCNQTSFGIDGCDLLCCGRGYRDVIDTEEEMCNCTFQWCCQLDCKMCLKQVRRTQCN